MSPLHSSRMISIISSARLPRVRKSCCINWNSSSDQPTPKAGVRQAHPILLEPIMRADVNVDEEQLGTVIGDLGRRRGSVSGVHVRGNSRNVVGDVPLAEARGYATNLRDFTHGRGTFTLEFRRYDLVPETIAEQIIKQRRAEGKIPRR